MIGDIMLHIDKDATFSCKHVARGQEGNSTYDDYCTLTINDDNCTLHLFISEEVYDKLIDFSNSLVTLIDQLAIQGLIKLAKGDR